MKPAPRVRGGRARAYATALEAFRRLPLALRRLVIRHATPNYTLGAVAVCRDDQGRVLLLRSRHHAAWSLPGGLAQRGEQPAEVVTRELREELGIDIAGALGENPGAPLVDTGTQALTVVFLVDAPITPRADGVEVVEARWFDPWDLPAALLRGTRESLALMGVPLDRAT